MNFKTLNKKSMQWKSVTSDDMIQETVSKNFVSQHKSRHLRLMRKQMQDLVHSHRRISSTQESVNGELLNLKMKVDSMNATNYCDNSIKLQELISEQQKTSDAVQNITSNVDNFNKVHISMLELLENMENLENKVDKTVPSFQKEISKIEIDIAQMNSHNAYLKEDQENIRQSVKAIAVGVSNMVDKVDLDHVTLQKINDTVDRLVHQSKQHFYKLADHISKAESNEAQNFTTDPDEMPALMGELQELKNVQEEFEDIVSHLPESCGSVKGPAGNYLIAPGPGAPVQTACKDGWTLVQQRNNGSVDFNRNFKEYAAGFGSPSGEFWIGNEALHRLTVDNCTSLRVEMNDIYGKFWQADYTDFSVGPASSGYRLIVSGFSGNASDALEYQNRMEFSTIDKDRDISNTHCAGNYEGGWWFSHCQHANLNGKYTLGLTWFDGAKNEWIAVASSRITLRTRPDCQN